MSQAGYLYVLINPSMQGMVKVGKTARSPAERAAELSRTTGVPTPFIVAFEQYFLDCDAAERHVHLELETAGHRVSANREFFAAPTSDVIKAVMRAPNPAMPVEGGAHSIHDEADTPAWAPFFNEAEEHFYGLNGRWEDHERALKLYKTAAELGSLLAHAKVGNIYEGTPAVKRNLPAAISAYKQGAAANDQFCNFRLVFNFAERKEWANARLSAERLKLDLNCITLRKWQVEIEYAILILLRERQRLADDRTMPPRYWPKDLEENESRVQFLLEQLQDLIRISKSGVRERIESQLDYYRQNPNSWGTESFESIARRYNQISRFLVDF